jgi:diguanylate cyclase (GGDEF)-like protein
MGVVIHSKGLIYMREKQSIVLWLSILSLARQATLDPLTGLRNRRFFDETLQDHIQAAKRYQRPLSLLFIDIDRLKKINDTQGHSVGDQILCSFAEILKKTLRKSDISCRYGGDEFAVLLPETTHQEAQHLIQRIQEEIAQSKATTPYSVSIGIAESSVNELLETADADLRNKKIIFSRTIHPD